MWPIPICETFAFHKSQDPAPQWATLSAKCLSNVKYMLGEVHTFQVLYISKNINHSFLFSCSTQLKLKIKLAERN